MSRGLWLRQQGLARSFGSEALFGTLYVLASIFMLRRLGAATLIALLVAGQTLGSLIVDHFGLFGVRPHPMDITRLAGAALLVGGVLLIRH